MHEGPPHHYHHQYQTEAQQKRVFNGKKGSTGYYIN